MDAPTPNPPLATLPDVAADVLSRVRQRAPRVHCLTNAVAQNFTANVLLAAGAVPSMTAAPEEIAQFVAHADALLINLGTLDRERREAAGIAVEVASGKRTPWVLDPVFVERSQSRAEFANTLMTMTPRAIRLNGAEFAAIAGSDPAPDTLTRYARGQHCVVALTGATDAVTDGARNASIENGAALMGQVTAMGCAGTALIAACLAVEPDAWLAASSALLAFAVAGDCAAARARGPGSMVFELLDSLAGLDRDALLARARVR